MKRTSDPATSLPSCRDCSDLFASQLTVHCALKDGCIPCAYKIGTFDVALDVEFCRTVPNQRPEQCCRASSTKNISSDDPPPLFVAKELSVLTVGDGDFTYSLAIGRIVLRNGGKLVATSYESKDTLLKVYPDITETIIELENLGAKLYYQVDATNLKTSLPYSAMLKFDRIVWNFPCCSAVSKGQDGQNQAMETNKSLVRTFVSTARLLLSPNGQIHMNHKTKPPFNQWRIERVALEESEDNPRMIYCGRIIFDRSLFVPYTPRKALDRKSFPVHDACTYVFARNDGCNPFIQDTATEFDDMRALPSGCTLVPVANDLILRLRSAFISQLDSGKRKKKRRRTNNV